MRKYHVYGMGAALVDTEIEVTDQELVSLGIDKGLMTLVDAERHQQLTTLLTSSGHLTVSKKACGGSAANTLIALSYFGSNGFFSCKVANDKNGQIYLQGLADAGIETPSNTMFPQGESGRCLVLITPDAERSMNTYLGVSETLSVDNVDVQAVGHSTFVYIESYLVTSQTGWAAALKALETARKEGAKTAISLSDPGIVTHFKEGLKQAVGDGFDLLFCNAEEALAWTDCDNLDDAAIAMQESAKQFVITLGSKGAMLYDGQNFHMIMAHPVTAVDTNGAGDMFAGAFLFGLSQNYDFKRSGEFASLAAATVVSHFGPRLHPHQHQELLQEFVNMS